MKEKIYDVMVDVIGWRLEDYDDYKNTTEYDLNNLEHWWGKLDYSIDKGEIPSVTIKDLEDLRDSIGFIIDFVRAVAIIDNTEKMKEEKQIMATMEDVSYLKWCLTNLEVVCNEYYSDDEDYDYEDLKKQIFDLQVRIKSIAETWEEQEKQIMTLEDYLSTGMNYVLDLTDDVHLFIEYDENNKVYIELDNKNGVGFEIKDINISEYTKLEDIREIVLEYIVNHYFNILY